MGSITVGETYSSSKYGRYIQVLAIDKEDNLNYTLAILWVDKVTQQTEPDDLVVSKVDTALWSKVEI